MVKLFQGPPPPPTPAPQVPEGVKQIANSLEAVMPYIERITGLTRRDLSLQLLKTGLKGGNLESLINGLVGYKPQPEAKIIRYVKIFAFWVPAFVFLMCAALVGAFVLFKLAMVLVGSL